MLIPIGFLGGGAPAGSYELISTTLVGSTPTNITLSSIPSTYKHLQLRIVAKGLFGATTDELRLQFNGDTSSTYVYHNLFGNGTNVTSNWSGATDTSMYSAYIAGANTANVFGAGIIDIFDYASTTKNKTVRSLSGVNNTTNRVYLRSGLWMSTAAINQIKFLNADGSGFAQNTRVSLYGIKGA